MLLSDYFGLSLDELVRDLDVQDVRTKSLTDEKVASIFSDVERAKGFLGACCKILCYGTLALLVFIFLCLVAHLLFPDTTWLWQMY